MSQPDNRRPPNNAQVPLPGQYGAPQYGGQAQQPNYAQPYYGQPTYDQYGQPIYPQQPYPQQPQYGQAPPHYGQQPYAQPQYGQPIPKQPAYGHPPAQQQPAYGQFGQPIYPQQSYAQQGYAPPEPQPIVVTSGTGWSGPAPVSQRSILQKTRKKTYLEAQWILAFIGIIEIAVTGFTMMSLEARIDKVIEAQIAVERKAALAQGMELIIDPVKLNEERSAILKVSKIICFVVIGAGVFFIGLALAVPAYPLGATLIGLTLYVAAYATVGYVDPSTIFKGWIMKGAFTAGLIRAVMAASAYKKESRLASFAGSAR